MTKERPEIKNILKENMTKVEVFQNSTLRPIIKMQHNLLIAVFNNYLINSKVDVSSLSKEKLSKKIKTIFLKDNPYKNFNVGLIVGHFTTEEFDFYAQNSSEVKRRILKIIAQRIEDS